VFYDANISSIFHRNPGTPPRIMPSGQGEIVITGSNGSLPEHRQPAGGEGLNKWACNSFIPNDGELAVANSLAASTRAVRVGTISALASGAAMPT
jgi:hypothetical protein